MNRYAIAGIATGAVLALVAFLVWTYGNSREHAGKLEERIEWRDEIAERDRTIARLNLENAHARTVAAERYADKLASFEPVIVHNTETITRFAETPAGRVVCLDGERVRGIEGTAAALGFPVAASTGGAPREVPALSATAIP